MAVQDRNIHRDARALRKSLTVPIQDIAVGDINADVPFFALQPRYNYRVMDLEFYAGQLATTAAQLMASVCPNLSVVGTPILGAAAAVTFTIQEFWQNDGGVLTNVAAVAAQAFGNAAVVADGGWGVWLVQIDGAQTITTKPYGLAMNFATEEIALQNVPEPDPANGVVAILTLNAVGGPFTAGTTNTNDAVVAAFNTASRNGHVASVAIGTDQYGNATLGQKLKDEAGVRILEGKGGTGGDLLVLSGRATGAADFTDAVAIVEYRPFPAQGEGRGDMSASQTEANFVP